MPLIRCPICRRQFDSSTSSALPFCSDRCRRIDFGRWLGEEYTMPVEPTDEEESDYSDEQDDL